jgi:Ca2+/H+ antiporter, TMEM165/GDT1 family
MHINNKNIKKMRFFGKEQEKKQRVRGLMPLAFVAGVFILSGVVMYLWNTILTEAVGFHTITFWKAMGILVLSKILFSGFPSINGHHGFRGRHGHELREKWMQLTPEEREKMIADLKTGWRSRFGRPMNEE